MILSGYAIRPHPNLKKSGTSWITKIVDGPSELVQMSYPQSHFSAKPRENITNKITVGQFFSVSQQNLH